TKDDPQSCLSKLKQLYADKELTDDIKDFIERIVKGVKQNQEIIDEKISSYATNWQLNRMPVVDRNILRMGCFELLFCKDIPPKVSINEAVELAKKFSTEEAPKFINGILDKIKKEKENQKN
ncbi:MAG: transcription antitermination factor NusB, partial [Candidatus Omnitrophica bacterium]|nr:transcription antitermination factor NusB [Candidatus Omnitrophota bacterium]